MPYGHRRKHGLLDPDPSKWPRETKERIAALALAEEALDRSRQLESRGWRAWYREMFGAEYFTKYGVDLVDTLAPHHAEAIEWHWHAMIARRAGLDITNYAYFAIWSRGHMKSTIARYMAIADACVGGIGYCLYVSGTKNKVRGHAISIETLLTSTKVKEYYPKLTVVKRNEAGGSKGWQADFIYTDSGYVFHFISLDEGVAGANIDNVRPTWICLDDVDDRENSPLISENRMRVLTRAVLPTRQHNTLVFWAQNFISRHSVLYAVYTGKARFLTARIATKPVPAFENLIIEQQTINGIIRDVITRGTPTWAIYDIKRAQEEIDTIGLEAFMAECQHDVDADKAGLVIPEYDDAVHVITWEEFNAVYGLDAANRDMPVHWRRYVGHDWGSSGVEGGHACVVPFVSIAAANAPLPGTAFLYHCPTFPASVLAGTVAHSILNFVLADRQSDPRTYIELALLDRGVNDPADVLATRTRTQVQDAIADFESYVMWHMSHEQKAVRDIYRLVYGLNFVACNPKRDGGVAQLRHYFRTDYATEHPFRTDIPGGLSRFYIVVDNAEQRRRPTDDSGMKLVRDQLSEWRWRPPTLTSKGYLDERPMKVDDDIGNALMMIFTHFRLQATPLTDGERIAAAIPTHLRYENLRANSPFEHGLTPEQELSHLMALRHAKRTADTECGIQRWDEYGQAVLPFR